MYNSDDIFNQCATSTDDVMVQYEEDNAPVGELLLRILGVTGKSGTEAGDTQSDLKQFCDSVVKSACDLCTPASNTNLAGIPVQDNYANIIIGCTYERIFNENRLSRFINEISKGLEKFIYVRFSIINREENFCHSESCKVNILYDKFSTVYQNIDVKDIIKTLQSAPKHFNWIHNYQVDKCIEVLKYPYLSFPTEDLADEPDINFVPSNKLSDSLAGFLNALTTEEEHLLPHQLTSDRERYGGLSSFEFPSDYEYSYLLRGMSFMKKWIPVKLKDSDEMPEFRKYIEDISDEDWQYLPSKDSCMMGCYTHEKDDSGNFKPVIYLCPNLIENMAKNLCIDKEVAYTKVLIHEFAHALMDASNQIEVVGGKMQLHVESSYIGRYYNRIEEIAMEESLANAFTLKWFEMNDSKSFNQVKEIIEHQSPIYKFGINQYNVQTEWTNWREAKAKDDIPELRSWFNKHFSNGQILG